MLGNSKSGEGAGQTMESSESASSEPSVKFWRNFILARTLLSISLIDQAREELDSSHILINFIQRWLKKHQNFISFDSLKSLKLLKTYKKNSSGLSFKINVINLIFYNLKF